MVNRARELCLVGGCMQAKIYWVFTVYAFHSSLWGIHIEILFFCEQQQQQRQQFDGLITIPLACTWAQESKWTVWLGNSTCPYVIQSTKYCIIETPWCIHRWCMWIYCAYVKWWCNWCRCEALRWGMVENSALFLLGNICEFLLCLNITIP